MFGEFVVYCHACGKRYTCGDCITMTCSECYAKGHRDGFDCPQCTKDELNLQIDIMLKLTKELKTEVQSKEFYKKRIDLINKIKHNFQEPYLTMICDIIANGNLRPEHKKYLKNGVDN